LDVKPGEEVSVGLKSGNPGEGDSFLVTHSNGQSRSLIAPLPRQRGQNPLGDPAQRERLNQLEDSMSRIVIGQPDALKMVTRGIRNKAVNATDPRPATFLLLGRTGTGKTETGKAIAEARYGDQNKLISFNMGDVKWEGDLNQIFGVTTGFVGGDKVGVFERFLQDQPEGGVLMFDEIGNMGGGSTVHAGSGSGANTKKELLMKFYRMIDEGKWRSPTTGKEYDLRRSWQQARPTICHLRCGKGTTNLQSC
jgi:hypothetical protein